MAQDARWKGQRWADDQRPVDTPSSGVVDREATADGLNPFTISQMPSPNSQMNSGTTVRLPNTDVGSKTPNSMPTKRARSTGPAMSPSVAMPRGMSLEVYIK